MTRRRAHPHRRCRTGRRHRGRGLAQLRPCGPHRHGRQRAAAALRAPAAVEGGAVRRCDGRTHRHPSRRLPRGAFDRAVARHRGHGDRRFAFGRAVQPTAARWPSAAACSPPAARRAACPGCPKARRAFTSSARWPMRRRLREAMAQHAAVTVLGAGFLGLEIASTARALGLAVTVLESADRVLPRARAALILGLAGTARARQRRRPAAAACAAPRSMRTRTASRSRWHDGGRLDAALLVVAIGLVPEVALARASGLELHRGQRRHPHRRAGPHQRAAHLRGGRLHQPVPAAARRGDPARVLAERQRAGAHRRRGDAGRCGRRRGRRPGSGPTSSAATSRCWACRRPGSPITCAASRPAAIPPRNSCRSDSTPKVDCAMPSPSTPAATCASFAH